MNTHHQKSAASRPATWRHPLPPGTRAGLTWGAGSLLALALAAGMVRPSAAADHPAAAAPAAAEAPPAVVKKPATAASAPKNVAEQLREAVETGGKTNQRMTLVINGKEKKYITIPAHAKAAPAEAPAKPGESHETVVQGAPLHPAVANPKARRQYLRAKAAALAGHQVPAVAGAAPHDGEVHWAYEGINGPQAWGKLKPDFNVCAIGKRQSPINIEETGTLQGPAEALQFNYQPSSGTVVNNGHTIQVDLLGDNTLTVRGSSYKLVQFHFHHPSEEQVNYRGFAMVAHLVHKNAEGQLAVVAVLLEPGVANALINKVWTYMPLDSGDRVRMPVGLIELNELLPKDQRYYQFMGSLTTPPCTEGVLWMVLKQPTPVSREQIKLFSQLFPNNARPVQALNGRAVRDAQ
jgi:carbonic anhydrase